MVYLYLVLWGIINTHFRVLLNNRELNTFTINSKACYF